MAVASTIIRHEAQLRQATAQINQAKSIINSSSKACDQAAQQLLASWEGDSADAFAAEQLNFKSWWEKMIEVITEVVSAVETINTGYSTLDETIKGIIK